jgi:hypothetical protein
MDHVVPPGEDGHDDGSSAFGSAFFMVGSPEEAAQLAEQVQEWEVEQLCWAGRSATWPECPEHPGSHPLEPVAAGAGIAVWRCPRSQRVAGAIGGL